MLNNKILLVVVGETYRHRWPTEHHLENRGTLESYDLQMKASNSHLNFIKTIENKLNIKTDVCLFVYSLNQSWDFDFIDNYKNYLAFNKIIYENRLGEQQLQIKLLNFLRDSNISEQYEAILFIRPDLYLKRYFSEIFKFTENKIKFAHVNEVVSTNNHCGCRKSNTLFDIRDNVPQGVDLNLPAVSHQIFYVPKKFFNLLFTKNIWNKHLSYYECLKYITKQEVECFINTFHSSCTSLAWNPIYSQVNRIQCEKWPDEGLEFDYETLSIKNSPLKQYVNLNRKKEY